MKKRTIYIITILLLLSMLVSCKPNIPDPNTVTGAESNIRGSNITDDISVTGEAISDSVVQLDDDVSTPEIAVKQKSRTIMI